MFRELVQLFRRHDVVKELNEMVDRMLDAGRWMFEQASFILMREGDWQQTATPLYQRDQEINRLEQELRRRIVTHLAVNGSTDAAACMVLMSVVKDAERIGDYCKNIFEVGRFYTRPFEHPEFREPLSDIREKVTALFEPTREAFKGCEAQQARAVLQQSREVGTQCDMIIEQLLKMHGDFPADEAVAYVLMARHFKRVARHLANIATSVVAPVHKLDFHDE